MNPRKMWRKDDHLRITSVPAYKKFIQFRCDKFSAICVDKYSALPLPPLPPLPPAPPIALSVMLTLPSYSGKITASASGSLGLTTNMRWLGTLISDTMFGVAEEPC